jgi:type I restriction enzyme S subunit
MLMGEWKESKLSEVAIIIMGQSPLGETCNAKGEGLPLLNGPTEFGVKSPTPIQFTTDPKKKCQIGDVLFCVRGSTTGRMNWADQVYAIGRGLAAIRHKEGLEYQHFIKGLLDYHLPTMLLSATGSTFPNVSGSDLNDLEIDLPPLPEQHSIASILSSLDNKIDLLQRQNKTLEELAETLFRQWFVEEAEVRWEITTLLEHTEVFRGLSYKGSGLSDESTGIPMHNLNSVHEGGGYKYEGIKYYNGDFRDRHIVKPGDIIVANTEQGHEFRLIGFPAIVPNYYGDKGIFSQHIYKLSIQKNTYLTTQFIYYLLKTPKIREQIIGATNGSTVNMLAIDGLQRPEFNLPPIERVQLFSEIVGFYWKKKEENQLQIRTLAHLRDTLLPKLMSGEVRVEMEELNYEN